MGGALEALRVLQVYLRGCWSQTNRQAFSYRSARNLQGNHDVDDHTFGRARVRASASRSALSH